MLKPLSLLILFSLFVQRSEGFSIVPERRTDRVSTKHGYLFIPAFVHVPGIGDAYGAGYVGENILNSRTDFSIFAVTGDLNAVVVNLADIRLLDNHLGFEFTAYGTKFASLMFDRGGFSDVSSYFASIRNEYGSSGMINLTFWQSRLKFYGHLGPSKIQTTQVSDTVREKFDINDNTYFDTVSTTFGTTLDLTDSVLDPREGLRVDLNRDGETIFDPNRSHFYSVNLNTTAYLPVGRNTWAFNYFRSKAFITQQSSLTQNQLQNAMTQNCSQYTDPTVRLNCQNTESQRVKERFTENLYGTAGSLGGDDRSRGYLSNRFHGSETQFFGTEFRWNLTDEGTPFNLGFMEGVRSNFQLAFFYELGAVSDLPLPIEESPYRSTYGAGFRVLFSGLALRADLGFSAEGAQFIFFVGYPWQGSVL